MDGGHDGDGQGKKKEGVKKGIDVEAQRRRREQHLIQIRKKKQEEHLSKRRGLMPADDQVGDGTGFAPALVTASLAVDIARYTDLVIRGTTEQERLEGTTAFRKMLSAEKNPPLDEVIQHGVIPYFVAFLSYDANPQLQFEAAWSLTNVASGTSAHTTCVIQAQAIPAFIRLLLSPKEEVREQATWALGNIAGDSPTYRDLVLANNALDPLLSVFQPMAKLSVLRNATWTLSNLCRGKPAPDFKLVGRALPTLSAVMAIHDHDVLCDSLWALSYLSDGPNVRVQAVLESAVVTRVVDLLGHSSVQVVTPALRTIGNIVTGDDLQTQAVLNMGVLAHLHRLLQSPKRTLRKEAAWAVSNIMAGTPMQIQQVLDANIMQLIVQLIEAGESDVRKEAAWAVCNGTSGGSPDQIAFMVQCGVIPPLIHVCAIEELRLVGIILEGFDNILRAGDLAPGGVNPYREIMESAGIEDMLVNIQRVTSGHEHVEVYNQVDSMLTRYFHTGEEQYDAPAIADVAWGAAPLPAQGMHVGGGWAGAGGAPAQAPGGSIDFSGFSNTRYQ